MSSTNALGNEVADESRVKDEYTHEREGGAEAVVDEVAEREANLRPTVEMGVQARVDTNAPEIGQGLTLEEEERLRAREWEIGRTRARFDKRQTSDREARTREYAAGLWKRSDGVRESGEPRVDPRETLSREELGAVNREAMRMAERVSGWSTAELSRRLALRVERGVDLTDAVLELFEELQSAERPNGTIPIGALESVRESEVDVEGEVVKLWKPSHSSIQQVGLLEDETGTVKFTVWAASRQTSVREGERVRFRAVARNWYRGRVTVALTSESWITFPDAEKWWTE